ncbi:MAG: cupin domain-containing protein [Pseudolabrys sp.]|nr:cupin domain-containing protein [Pseudolabrys sp.]
MAGEPLTFRFADDGAIPNNPRLPMLFYPGALNVAGDMAQRMEAMFATNGWGFNGWRDGIFPYVHYHSMIHEVLAIAQGHATVQFGGPSGKTVDVKVGDVAVLPAGTGHQNLDASSDLLVIGSYPPQGTYNLCRGSKAEHNKALATIPLVPVPESDPVSGAGGPLMRLWRP